MPTVIRDERIQGYAHCVHPFCPGNEQTPVDARLIETAVTYQEQGGDLGGFEKSFVTITPVNADDRECPHCERPREITDQVRRDYMPLSGHDPNGLLRFKYPEQYEAVETRDAKLARLREEIAALEAA